MAKTCECERIVIAAFEEAALVLAGVAAEQALPEEAVWDLARGIDVACERAQARLARHEAAEAPPADDPSDLEHPAIVHLLRRLHQHRANVGVCARPRGECL